MSPQDILEPLAHDLVKQWVSGFVKQCGRIIRNYQDTILKEALNEAQRAALQIHEEP